MVLLFQTVSFTEESIYHRFSIMQRFQSQVPRIKSRYFLFIWSEKKVFFLSSYKLPTHKENQSYREKIHAYLTDSSQYSTCLLKNYSRLQYWPPRWASKTWLLSLINISYKLSATNDYFKILIFFIDERYS